MSSKEPSIEDQEKYLELRVIGKRGGPLSSSELKFLVKMYDKYSKWTKGQESIVWDRSKPFGA